MTSQNKPIITPDNYREHIVKDGKLQIITASSIKEFKRCPVRWYRQTVLGQKPEDTEAMDLGRCVHRGIEIAIEQQKKIEPIAYVDNPVWESAQKALDFIGRFGEPEVPMKGEMTIAGIPVWGRIDLIQREPGLRVIDWKTIGKSAIPSRSRLELDPQKILYSEWAHAKSFLFVYLFKDQPQYSIRPFVESLAEPFPTSELFQKEVQLMKALAEQPNEPSLSECTCGRCYMGQIVKTPRAEKATDFDLCIDCVPLKTAARPIVLLDAVIASHCQAICEKFKVPDIRLIEFGKGKGYLADSIRKHPPSGLVYARSSDIANGVIDVLIPLAKQVYLRT